MSKAYFVQLTKLQAGELAHKAAIVRDEPDLCDSYDLSEAEAAELAEALDAIPEGGAIMLRADWVDCLTGEAGNCLDIAAANMDVTADPKERAQLAAYVGSMRGLRAKLRALK